MTLDKEEHRTILAQLIEQSAFPGKFAEEVVSLKQAVASAAVAETVRPNGSAVPRMMPATTGFSPE